MGRARPWLGGPEECILGFASFRARNPLRALVVVWLTRAIVSVSEGVTATFERVEPEITRFGGAQSDGVGLGQNACTSLLAS